MAAGPRLVFVRFATSESPKLKPWIAHAHRVLREVEDSVHESSTHGSIVWQLVSANNRQLARGTDVYETFEEAYTAACALAAASSSLTIGLVSEAGQGLYGWYLSLDGRPQITCARWYLTDRDRRNSITLAVRAMASATVNTGTRLSDSTLMADDRGALV